MLSLRMACFCGGSALARPFPADTLPGAVLTSLQVVLVLAPFKPFCSRLWVAPFGRAGEVAANLLRAEEPTQPAP